MATPLPPNVIKDDTGTFIAASQRPDGTWRKPRRVKDGYVPQEEVPLYESKGKQWAKSRPAGHVVGMTSATSYSAANNTSSVNAPRTIPGLTIAPTETQSGKSKKKKKKKASEQGENVDKIIDTLKSTKLEWPTGTEESKQTTIAATDPTKRLKNLKKRLREVEILEQKISSGELKNPDKDQLEKLKRKSDLKEQIEELEFEIDAQK